MELDQAALDGMSEDQILALMEQDGNQPNPEPIPVEPVQEVAPVQPDAIIEPAPGPSPEQAQVPQQQMVPLAALHEARSRLQQATQFLNDPAALKQHLAAQGYQINEPDMWIEPDQAVNFHVQQATAPLQYENQTLKAQLQEYSQREQLAEVRKAFPDADELIAIYDQHRPDFAQSVSAYDKAATVHGARMANPEYRQQIITAEAQKLAEKMTADALKSGKSAAPVTLSGIAPAQPNDTKSFEDLGQDDMNGMSEAALLASMKKAYGGA